MTVPFLDLSWQEAQIKQDREKRFSDVIDSSAFVFGPAVSSFEEEFSSYLGVPYTIGVGGGTHALTMIFQALGIGRGDEVVVSASTFIASVTGMVQLGAKPVFVDIDKETRMPSLSALEEAITPKTKAILAVHLYGQPADMEGIMALAEKHNLVVVEDACQAHGARIKEKRVGTFGVASAFSFYPGKNLGAYGDGGAVVTHDADIARVVRALRNQGCITKYEHEFLGYNSRLDALQAAVLSAKLPHLDTWNQMRTDIVHMYREAFKNMPFGLPPEVSDTTSVWHLFVLDLQENERTGFMSFLQERGVGSGIHYPIPPHLTKALVPLGYTEGMFPETERLANSCVSLPLFPGMTKEQAHVVIDTVTSYVHERKA